MRQFFSSGPILVMTFCLLSFFAINLYQSSLLSQLLATPQGTPFKTLDGMISMIEQKRYTLAGISFDTAFYSRLENSEFSFFPALRDACRANPPILQPNLTQLLDGMEEKGVYIMSVTMEQVMSFIQSRCRLEAFVPMDAGGDWLAYIFQKKSNWLPVFQHGIIALESFVRFIEKRYTKLMAARCNPIPREEVPLSVFNFSGLFVLCACGLGVGVLGLLVEMVVRKVVFRKGTSRTLSVMRSVPSFNDLSNMLYMLYVIYMY